MKYENFKTQLLALGKSDRERSEKLGVSKKTISRYRDGILPEPLSKLMRYPSLLQALFLDAQERINSHD